MVLCKELERFDAGPALSIRPLAFIVKTETSQKTNKSEYQQVK
jgi:hypothetical protein